MVSPFRSVTDRGQQLVVRRQRLGAGIENHEATGAVGALDHAGFETGLPDQRRLLVASDSGNRNLGIEQRLAGVCRKSAAQSSTSGNSDCRDQQQVEEFADPIAARWILNISVREALVASVA